MSKRFSVEAIFKGIDKISRPVSRMQQRIGRFTRVAGKKVSALRKRFANFSKGFKKFAVAGVAAFAVVGYAAADVVRTGAAFEQSIVNATVKVGGLDQQSQKFIRTQKLLTDEARRLGKSTEFTAGQAAEGLNTLVMAGFSADQSVAALTGVLDLATIAQIDMAEAADIATGALGSFNLKADDSVQLSKNLARVNDVLAKTAITSKNTMFDLSEALKDGGPSAKLAGAEIETFAALAGKMADGNIRATKAGTTIKNMFLRLAKPAADAQRIMKRWNISTMDADGNMRDVVDVLGDLEGQLNNLGTGQRAAVIETIFGKRAIAGVSVILEKGVKDLRSYREELKNVSGESTKMANITRNTVSGSLKALFSSIESVKLSIFNANKGPLKDMIENMTKWIRANEDLIAADVGDVIKSIVDSKDDLLAVAKAFGSVATAIMNGVKAFKVAADLIALKNKNKSPRERFGNAALDLPDIGGWNSAGWDPSRWDSPASMQTAREKLAKKEAENRAITNSYTAAEKAAIMSPDFKLGQGEIIIRTEGGAEATVTKEDKNLKLNTSPTGAF